jgi:hypothetical protein
MPEGKTVSIDSKNTSTQDSPMKKAILLSALALASGSLLAADSNPKDDVTTAAKKLGAQANYSWTTTVVVPEGSRFRPGPTEGKTEKDGYTCLSLSFGDNKTQAVLKGEKAAFTDREGEWQSAADQDSGQGPGRFLGRMVRSFKTPAVQASDLASATKELKTYGDVYAGDLTEEGAKALLTFRARGGGGDGPTVSNPKGSVKFWLKGGALSKYEFKLLGKVEFNGNEMDVDRTTTVEVKDVGTTKVEVPAEAKKKLS